MLSRHHSTSSYSYQPDHQHPPVHDYRSNAYPDSPAVSPRVMRRPFDPVSEAVHPTSPGSDSSHDYVANPHAVYPQYGRQEFYTYPPTRLPSERRFSMSSPAEPPSPQTSLSGSKDSIQTKGSRKNKYPCPYAASHSCSATFTTSGHAARHGKKHTGEKSVHCPICNKAFTRKDNMKQHIRTHRTNSEDSQTGLVRDGTSAYSPNHSRSISQSRVDRNVYQSMPRVDSTVPRGSHQMPF